MERFFLLLYFSVVVSLHIQNPPNSFANEYGRQVREPRLQSFKYSPPQNRYRVYAPYPIKNRPFVVIAPSETKFSHPFAYDEEEDFYPKSAFQSSTATPGYKKASSEPSARTGTDVPTPVTASVNTYFTTNNTPAALKELVAKPHVKEAHTIAPFQAPVNSRVSDLYNNGSSSTHSPVVSSAHSLGALSTYSPDERSLISSSGQVVFVPLPGLPGIPSLPGVPSIPSLPGLPSIPSLPSAPLTSSQVMDRKPLEARQGNQEIKKHTQKPTDSTTRRTTLVTSTTPGPKSLSTTQSITATSTTTTTSPTSTTPPTTAISTTTTRSPTSTTTTTSPTSTAPPTTATSTTPTTSPTSATPTTSTTSATPTTSTTSATPTTSTTSTASPTTGTSTTPTTSTTSTTQSSTATPTTSRSTTTTPTTSRSTTTTPTTSRSTTTTSTPPQTTRKSTKNSRRPKKFKIPSLSIVIPFLSILLFIVGCFFKCFRKLAFKLLRSVFCKDKKNRNAAIARFA